MEVAEPVEISTSHVTACAAQGRLLAFATVMPVDDGWALIRNRSRLFQLEARSSEGMRNLALEVRKFISANEIEYAAFCRRSGWEVDDRNSDEVRIEALLCVMPGLKIEIHDHDIVSSWVVRERPEAPKNVTHQQHTYAQRRAIEMAQYISVSPSFGEWI